MRTRSFHFVRSVFVCPSVLRVFTYRDTKILLTNIPRASREKQDSLSSVHGSCTLRKHLILRPRRHGAFMGSTSWLIETPSRPSNYSTPRATTTPPVFIFIPIKNYYLLFFDSRNEIHVNHWWTTVLRVCVCVFFQNKIALELCKSHLRRLTNFCRKIHAWDIFVFFFFSCNAPTSQPFHQSSFLFYFRCFCLSSPYLLFSLCSLHAPLCTCTRRGAKRGTISLTPRPISFSRSLQLFIRNIPAQARPRSS